MKTWYHNALAVAALLLSLLIGCASPPTTVQETRTIGHEDEDRARAAKNVKCFDGLQSIDERSRPVRASTSALLGGKACYNDVCIAGTGWYSDAGAYCIEDESKITYRMVEILGPKRGNVDEAFSEPDQGSSARYQERDVRVVRFEGCTGVVRLEDGTAVTCGTEAVFHENESVPLSDFTGTIRLGETAQLVQVVFRLGDAPEAERVRREGGFTYLTLLGYAVRFEDFKGVVSLENGTGVVVRCGDGVEVARGGEIIRCADYELITLGGGVIRMGDEYYVRAPGLFRLEDYTGVVRFEPG